LICEASQHLRSPNCCLSLAKRNKLQPACRGRAIHQNNLVSAGHQRLSVVVMCMRVICGPPVLSGCGSLSSGSKQPNETFIYLRCAPRDDGFADTARMRYQTRCCGERGEKLIAAHATGSLMLTQVQPANKARPFYFIYT
jgi:hypothetical protein